MAELKLRNWPVRAWPAHSAWCCLALAAISGCRNLDNAQVDVLESQLRQQEDYIYELEDYLIEYSEKLRHARMAQCQPVATTKASGSAAVRAPAGEPTLDVDRVERPTLPLNGRNKVTPPAGTEASPADAAPAEETFPSPQPENNAEPEAIDPEQMEPPELEIGSEVGALPWRNSTATAKAPTLPPETGAEGPLLIPDPVDYQADAETSPAAAPEIQPAAENADQPRLAAPAQNASRLSAQRLHIRRIFAEPAPDDKKSPASLLVVVEALNATNEPVDASGEASLMIMARDAPGSLQRIDRWDFTVEETAAAWQSSKLGDGLHLELPLSEQELPEQELELWVRLVSSDGKKLLTQIPFDPTQLASIADAADETTLASAVEEAAKPQAAAEAQRSDKRQKTAAAEMEPAPKWRASSVPLDPNRVEGYASTAGGKPAGWISQPNADSQPRVASASSKSSSPTWQRSSAAHADSKSHPDWTPNR